MPYSVELLNITANTPTAVVRRRASGAELCRVVPEACGVVWSFVRAQHLKAGRNIALYLDDQINLEVGVELQVPFAGDGEVVASCLPRGLTATTVHFGAYPQLAIAHQAIHEWCQAEGHTLAGPRWEIYGHWQSSWDTDPSQIRTDVCYLLKAMVVR